MNFLFAWRYFKSKKTTNAVNIIAWISVVAIAVGTASLIIVLSVFNGFEDLVKSLYKDFYSDIKISAPAGKKITLTPGQILQLKKTNGVAQLSMIAEEKAFITNNENHITAIIKGVDDNYTNTNKIAQHIITGKFKTGTLQSPQAVLGNGIQSALDINTQPYILPITLYMPNANAANLTTIDALNSFNILPSGVFIVQQDFDDKYVFTNLGFVKYMLNMQPDEYTSAEIKVSPGSSPDKIKTVLEQTLGKNYLVETRYEQNKSLFAVMTTERVIIYVILSLILFIAAFNIIGALIMLVLEKQKDVAILKAIGTPDSAIQKIFLTEGFVLAGVGSVIGTILALIVCMVQLKFHLVKLGGSTFLIDYFPVQLHLVDFILVLFTVLIITLIASWFPARKAAQNNVSLKS